MSGDTAANASRDDRDLLTLRGHVVFDWDRTAQLVGTIELGFEPSPTDMF